MIYLYIPLVTYAFIALGLGTKHWVSFWQDRYDCHGWPESVCFAMALGLPVSLGGMFIAYLTGAKW